MRDFRDYAIATRRHGRKILLGVLCGLALSACAHPVRPMLDDHKIVISGRGTAGSDPVGATRKTLVVAARMTLDHGFRYFKIIGLPNESSRSGPLSIRPGADVTIEVYRESEIDPRSPDIWDAVDIGAGSLPNSAR